jgi:hypothetical protein
LGDYDDAAEDAKYVNNWPLPCQMVTSNPHEMIEMMLRDLIILLKVHRRKGPLMFEAAKMMEQFQAFIEPQAGALRVFGRSRARRTASCF